MYLNFINIKYVWTDLLSDYQLCFRAFSKKLLSVSDDSIQLQIQEATTRKKGRMLRKEKQNMHQEV